MLISEGFQQTPYTLPPAWQSATFLRAIIRRIVPANVYQAIDADCLHLEERLKGNILDLYNRVDEPRLIQYDHVRSAQAVIENELVLTCCYRLSGVKGLIDWKHPKVGVDLRESQLKKASSTFQTKEL